MAAIAATITPTTRWSRVAAGFCEKPTNHGDTITHSPTTRLIHSSHSANAARAAMAKPAITIPLSQAFQLAAVSRTNPKSKATRTTKHRTPRSPHQSVLPFSKPAAFHFTSLRLASLDRSSRAAELGYSAERRLMHFDCVWRPPILYRGDYLRLTSIQAAHASTLETAGIRRRGNVLPCSSSKSRMASITSSRGENSECSSPLD